MAEARIRVALVGAGRMGQLRGNIMLRSSNFTVVYVVDPNVEVGTELAAQLGAQHVTTLSLALAAVDAVWVSTGTAYHRDVLLESLHARKPTFCEKPISDDAAVIRECYALADEMSTPLVCGFQRRFDKHYLALLDAVKAQGAVGTVQTVHVVFRDHPCPPIEFLRDGGDPFFDLAPHDVDFVNLLLGEEPCEVLGRGTAFHPVLQEAGVMDPALLYLKYPSGALVTMEMSRNAEYGYDQRIEVFGDKGMATARSPPETALEVANVKGFHTSVLDYSFPQRFAQAFAAEVEAFGEIVRGKRKPWVGVRECLAIHRICSAGLLSARNGELQRLAGASTTPAASVAGSVCAVVGPRVGLRLLGHGSFAQYMEHLLRKYPARHNFELLPPFTRSSGLDWQRDVLQDARTEAVYVCTPDDQHAPQAIACLRAGKCVLTEKPVLGWRAVREAAEASKIGWLHVGLQRRHDREYLRARAHCAAHTVKRAVFTAEDPWDADQDTESNPEQLVGVLCNSLCHEFDLLGWLWPDSTVTLSHVEPRANSGAYIAGTVHHAGGASTAFEVRFSKGHSTHYGQLVELDGRKFGYPQFKVAGFEEAGLLYEQAYVEQLARFYRSCVDSLDKRTARAEDEDVRELVTYSRAFDTMDAACKMALASHPAAKAKL